MPMKPTELKTKESNLVYSTKEWSGRQLYCNMLVVVEGAIYRLHKYPVLLKCKTLNKMTKQSRMPTPFIQIHEFPGGREMFEKVMMHCYRGGKVSTTPESAPVMYCAAQYLGMNTGPGNLVRQLELYMNSSLFTVKKDTNFTKLQMFLTCLLKIGPLAQLNGRNIIARCVEALSLYLSPSTRPKSLYCLNLRSEEFISAILVARKEGIAETLMSQLTAAYAVMYVSKENLGLEEKCRSLCELLRHIRCSSAVSQKIGKSLLKCGDDLRKKCVGNTVLRHTRDDLTSACAFAAQLA